MSIEFVKHFCVNCNTELPSPFASCCRDAGRYSNQRIVCAAIINRATKKIICGPRHFDEIMVAQIVGSKDPEMWAHANVEQGFVDQFGNFLSRRDAYDIAEYGQQIRCEFPKSTRRWLFSESLY